MEDSGGEFWRMLGLLLKAFGTIFREWFGGLLAGLQNIFRGMLLVFLCSGRSMGHFLKSTDSEIESTTNRVRRFGLIISGIE